MALLCSWEKMKIKRDKGNEMRFPLRVFAFSLARVCLFIYDFSANTRSGRKSNWSFAFRTFKEFVTRVKQRDRIDINSFRLFETRPGLVSLLNHSNSAKRVSNCVFDDRRTNEKHVRRIPICHSFISYCSLMRNPANAAKLQM